MVVRAVAMELGGTWWSMARAATNDEPPAEIAIDSSSASEISIVRKRGGRWRARVPAAMEDWLATNTGKNRCGWGRRRFLKIDIEVRWWRGRLGAKVAVVGGRALTPCPSCNEQWDGAWATVARTWGVTWPGTVGARGEGCAAPSPRWPSPGGGEGGERGRRRRPAYEDCLIETEEVTVAAEAAAEGCDGGCDGEQRRR